MTAQIERIAEKVRVQKRRLNPPLPNSRVVAFEQSHEISLPGGYREFIQCIGDGGDGPPHYGLNPLGQPACDMRGEERAFWTNLPHVGKPFPFTRYWIWEGGQATDEGTEDAVTHGSICIGNEGCGMYWHLIITGAERGNVWMITDEGIQPACPKRDFVTWYEDWLDGKDSFYAFPN
jgi:hypothetical protein